MTIANWFRTLFRARSSSPIDRLRDRDLADLGLTRSSMAQPAGHAPFDVPNDRT